jgi:hypothetical protein
LNFEALVATSTLKHCWGVDGISQTSGQAGSLRAIRYWTAGALGFTDNWASVSCFICGPSYRTVAWQLGMGLLLAELMASMSVVMDGCRGTADCFSCDRRNPVKQSLKVGVIGTVVRYCFWYPHERKGSKCSSIGRKCRAGYHDYRRLLLEKAIGLVVKIRYSWNFLAESANANLRSAADLLTCQYLRQSCPDMVCGLNSIRGLFCRGCVIINAMRRIRSKEEELSFGAGSVVGPCFNRIHDFDREQHYDCSVDLLGGDRHGRGMY